MDIKDLICVETVYRNGSITRASEILFMSPQAVSKRINKLFHVRLKETGEYDVERMVLENLAALGFAVSPIENNDLEKMPLLKVPFYAILNDVHPLADKTDLSIQEITKYPIVIKSREFKCNTVFLNLCDTLGIQSNIYLETPNTPTMYQLASENDCISISVKYDNLLHYYNNLVAIPISDSFYWEICLIYKKNTLLNNRLKALVEKIKTELPNLT